MFPTIAYGIITTLISAWKSDVILADVIAFGKALGKGMVVVWGKILWVASFVAKLGNKIPHPVAAKMIHWMLLIAVILVIAGAVAWITYIVLKKAIKYVVDEMADEISAFVILITLAIIVYLATGIKSILSINLVVAFGGVLLVYVIARALVKRIR